MDPEGYELYLKTMKDPVNAFMPFATGVAAVNPESADLQVKCLSLFILGDKFEEALKAATVLCE